MAFKNLLTALLSVCMIHLAWAIVPQNNSLELKSINGMAFGSNGVLFVGDSQQALIFAIETNDTESRTIESLEFKKVDVHIAALLGMEPNEIAIADMVVNPVSKTPYFGIHLQDGTPVLLKLVDNQFKVVDLEPLDYTKISLTNAVEMNAEDRRGRSLRKWAISGLKYNNGKVYVSGLSNEEFSSTFRVISYPFNDDQLHSSLEIYHAAHGRYETYAPIKTFMPYELNGKDHLIASYTCTPLVIFPMESMKSGAHIKGNTVAELGNRNTPLDIVSFEKKGKSYILMANTSRALMRIDPAKIETFSDYLTTPVSESSATAGVDFIALPYVNVLQMDKLEHNKVVLLQRMSNGDLNLHTPNINRL